MDPRQLAEHLRFYQELGVTGVNKDARWRSRALQASPPAPQASAPAPHASIPAPQASAPALEASAPAPQASVPAPRVLSLHHIREDIGDCTRCKLATLGRRQVVFGAGNPDADLMFVGEAPGADEDVQGVPFVGRAGQLLTKMIEAMGFTRDEVYIANVVKCRPPENRNPEPDEIERCEPFLFQQIESIRPKVIVALGAFAAKTLLRTQDPISRLRGQVYEYHGAQLVPTFHPSFLLRSPGQKKYAWDDLKKVLALMGRQPPSTPGPAA
jgi:uracil-DNA glycosylase family 4